MAPICSSCLLPPLVLVSQTLVHMYQGLGDQNEWRQEAATANRRHVLIFLVLVVFFFIIVNNDY